MAPSIKHLNLNLGPGRLHAKLLTHGDSLDVTAPVLVFLHEGLGCITMWRDFPDQLCDLSGLDALVFDRIGYGLSDPLKNGFADPDYLNREPFLHLPDVLHYLNINFPIFIGHSDGGTIALRYAARFPDNVTGLVSIAAHTFVDELTVHGISDALHLYQSNGFRNKLVRHHRTNTDSMFYRWAHTWLSDDHKNWNIIQELANIKAPVLAVQGMNDQYGTEAQVDSIVDTVSGYSEKIMIPDCAHVPHHEVRDFMLLKTNRFLETVCSMVPA